MMECVYFYRFPNTKVWPDLYKQWLKNMNFKTNIILPKHSRLCSDHFEKNCLYKNTKNVHLKTSSIPTVFKKCKKECVFCKATKGRSSSSFYK